MQQWAWEDDMDVVITHRHKRNAPTNEQNHPVPYLWTKPTHVLHSFITTTTRKEARVKNIFLILFLSGHAQHYSRSIAVCALLSTHSYVVSMYMYVYMRVYYIPPLLWGTRLLDCGREECMNRILSLLWKTEREKEREQRAPIQLSSSRFFDRPSNILDLRERCGTTDKIDHIDPQFCVADNNDTVWQSVQW